ncbi:cell division protein [Sphingobacteriaceae bacterium]|nr:cell division protein [Sphingobacteriaceae bacterium]
MPVIEIVTHIHSTAEICFDLSASIELHQLSTSRTNEKAIAGVTKGIIQLNETVTWQATHFGIRQKLTSVISRYERPHHFRDEQVKGAFKKFTHDHFFEDKKGFVIMTDRFEYASPLGIFGKIFNKLVLTNYLKKFLTERNQMIKEFAESGKWKELLDEKNY